MANRATAMFVGSCSTHLRHGAHLTWDRRIKNADTVITFMAVKKWVDEVKKYVTFI
jgi:hypothetical protein